jgi:serine/threonine-protein kinase Chk1
MAPKYPKILGTFCLSSGQVHRCDMIAGYELIQQIGGGSFSSVFRAVNIENHQVAACKAIFIKEQTTEKERMAIEKEMKIHRLLKHKHILEFLHASVVERKYKDRYVPGIYMLLELAAGGDLFDKIGALR